MSFDICQRCVLPATYPGISFDAAGICLTCRDFEDKKIDFTEIRNEVEALVRETLGRSPLYDIVVAYSGGKDSTYALKYLKETFPAARIVAITIDNDFLSDIAQKNCRQVTAALGIDHLLFRPNPKAMMEIYNRSLNSPMHSLAALKRASAVCNSCIQVINTQIVNFASSYQVPIVAGGYLGGQIPSETGFMKQNLEVTAHLRQGMVAKLQSFLERDAVRLFQQNNGSLKEILVLNPMAYLNVPEQNILTQIRSLGWSKPADTGKSSTNCLLNDYAIADHKKKLRFHPYVAETASMVRRGILSREEALEKMNEQISESEFGKVEEHLKRYT